MLTEELTRASTSREIAEAIERAIEAGEFTPGAQLPSIRTLTKSAKVSPGTVALAYKTLADHGYIVVRQGSRARVSAKPPTTRVPRASVPSGVRDVTTMTPSLRLLPDVAAMIGPSLYRPQGYDSANATPEFAAAMRAQFARDGIEGELTVTNGALDAIERIADALLRRGDLVLVEDPGWVSSMALLRAKGFDVAGVAIDDEGMIPGALEAALTRRRAAAVLVTPRAQNPLGAAMTEGRAAELREVLDTHPDTLVIEDDHASLVAGAPSVTITRGRGRWAVVRSLSKSFGPDLRIAALASDRETADAVQGRQLLGAGWVSHFTQRLAARLLTDPESLDATTRAEAAYAARRTELVSALATRGIPAHGSSGLTVAIPVVEEADAVAALLTQGWAVQSGGLYRMSATPFVRVCISDFDDGDADAFADALATHLTPSRRIRPT
ncbi:MAG: aminotransferase class I/II-fold pyridoxal phosphate-dependent enzyme [Protaetiibacter sp.]